jgi:hypothetical protein
VSDYTQEDGVASAPSSAVHQFARFYASSGAPVLPIAPRGKIPLTAHGLHDATTDVGLIDEWWSHWPDANIGLRTGILFDVLDIDGDEGVEELSRLLGDDDAALPPGPIAFTPNDGVHMYFLPSGLGNRARFRPGLDWRGTGGYVVAPPSVGANGRRYKWWIDDDGVHLDELVAVPAWLLEPLNPPRPEPRPAAHPFARFAHAPGYANAALADERAKVASAPVGCRNHTLNIAAFNLGQLAATGALDLATVAAQLVDAAANAGLTEHEARATIASGLRAGINQPREIA